MDATAHRTASCAPEVNQRPGRAGPLVVALLALSALSGSLVQTLVVPLLPLFPQLLHFPQSDAEWLVTVTLLTASICTPLLARLGDLYGRRRLLIIALGLLAAGSVVCAVSGSLPWMLLGRALQGAATATIPLGIGLVHASPLVRRPEAAVGLISAAMGIGGAIGLPLAGFVAEYASYTVLFWAMGATALLSGVGVVLVVPRDRAARSGRLDLVGFTAFTVLLLTVLLPLSQGRQWGWTSPRTSGLAVAFLLLLPLFVLLEWRHGDPAVDVRTLLHRPVLLTNVASMLTGFVLLENFVSTIEYVQMPSSTGYGLGLDTVVAALCMVPTGSAMALVAPSTGRLIAGRGARATLLLGLLTLLAGCVIRLMAASVLGMILGGSAVIGVGTALAFAAMPALVIAASPAQDAAAAAGLNALSRSTGSTIASAACGAVLAAVTVPGGFPAKSAFTILSVLAVGASALAVILIGCVPSRFTDKPA